MKRLVLITILLVSLIPLTLSAKPAAAADQWASAYADWQYRTAVTVSNSGSSDLTDFQVKVTLDSNWPGWAHVKQDGGDIRFATADGTTVPYYIESWDYTNKQAVIWIKVPSIPAGGSTTVYLYYGNSEATSESNGDAVFEFFDDFSGTSLDTTKWSTSGGTATISNSELTFTSGGSSWAWVYSQQSFSAPIIVTMKFRFDNSNPGTAGHGKDAGLENTATDSTPDKAAFDWNSGVGANRVKVANDGTETTYANSFDFSTIGEGTIVYTSTSVDFYWNGQLLHEFTSGLPNEALPIAFGTVGSGSVYVDFVFVRKYADPEPTASVSTSEEVNSGGYTVTLSLKDDAGNSLTGVGLTVTDANGNTVLSGTYSDGDTISLGDGTYNFLATKVGYIRAEQDSVSISADTTVSLALTAIPTPSISYSPNPPHVGDTVTATASASNLPSGYTYTYEYRFEDGSGNVLQDWSTTNTFNIPQSLAHGTLVIKARIKVQETGDYSNEGSVTVSIANSPPSTPTLSISPGTTATTGETITATASGSTDADGDSITYEYKFEDVTAGTLLQDWSTTNTYTTSSDQYNHVIRVWARAVDDSGATSDAVYVDVNVNNRPPNPPTTLTASTGMHVGKAFTASAGGATDPDGDTVTYEYRFIDDNTGNVIQDWGSASWTPSSSYIYHTIEVQARAKDSHGATSNAVSKVWFVLPTDTVSDVPLSMGNVKSKVIFTLSTAWSDVNGLMVKTDGQNGTFLLAEFGGVHWWANLSGNKLTIYSDSPLGIAMVPILTQSDIGSGKWVKDYAQTFIDFAATAGNLEGTAISPGTYIQSYDAYVAGISSDAILWFDWITYSYLGDWGGKYIKWNAEFPNGAAGLNEAGYQYYITTNHGALYLKADLYDKGQTAGSQPETNLNGVEGTHSGTEIVSLAGFESWAVNNTFNFYFFAENDFDNHLVGATRIISVSTNTNFRPILGTISVSGPSYTSGNVTINVHPLPVPTTVTFWFYDPNNNPLNAVDVYLGSTFLGTFDSGQSYTLDYAGTYTFTAKKLHFQDTSITAYVEGNAGVSFTMTPENYNVTVKIVDENSNPINATLYLDGTQKGSGKSEYTLLIPYGSHTLKAVDADGYSGTTSTIVDHDGQVLTITIEHPVTVTFIIYDNNNTELTGVNLELDGESYGTINSGDKIQVMRGQHSFEFSKDGYLSTTMNIQISSDTTLTVWLVPGIDITNETRLNGADISSLNITPINAYAKAFLEANGTFGDTVKLAILGDNMVRTLLPQLLILAIVIFILVQTHSPPAGIAGALAMQAMWVMFLGEAPDLKNSSLTFMLITFLVAWTLWDLFYNYARET